MATAIILEWQGERGCVALPLQMGATMHVQG